MQYYQIKSLNDLGALIKSLRKAAKLSQFDFAESIGISRTALQGIETNKPTTQLDTLMRVLEGLNVKLYLTHPLLPSISEITHEKTAD